MERRVPRVALSRVGTAAALALTGLLLALLLGDRAVRWIQDYVQGRPIYKHDFASIEFVPKPPAWIKSGREGLLAEILDKSKHAHTESLLARDLAGIEHDLLQSHWIRKISRVERSYPDRLTVRLPPDGYREPVARFLVGKSGSQASLVLDADCNVLPSEEINWAAAGPILQLDGFEALHLTDDHPGFLLKFATSDESVSRPDSRVQAAARFAAFLKARLTAANPPFEPVFLRHVAGKGFWTWTTQGYYILWGETDDPSRNADRWRRVCDWLARNPPPRRDLNQSLDASGDRVRLVQIPLAPGPGKIGLGPSR